MKKILHAPCQHPAHFLRLIGRLAHDFLICIPSSAFSRSMTAARGAVTATKAGAKKIRETIEIFRFGVSQ
jgi:hypothetical protein